MGWKVLVVCPNPALDVEWRVDGVREEEKNQILSERRWAGGKGVNVARWLGRLGVGCRVLLPIGGETGATLRALLEEEGLACEMVPITGATRVNVVMTTPEGRQWRFNQPGARLRLGEWRELEKRFVAGVGQCDLVVLSGSLPPGVRPDVYAGWIRRAGEAGVRVVTDCDGEALRCAVEAGPFLLKPNEAELSAWWGRTLRGGSDVLEAARAMSARSGNWVLVSCGGKPAWLVHESQGRALSLRPRRCRVRNRLGAGDALVAGVCWAMLKGLGPRDWLRAGVELGRLATRYGPGQGPDEAEVTRVTASAGGRGRPGLAGRESGETAA